VGHIDLDGSDSLGLTTRRPSSHVSRTTLSAHRNRRVEWRCRDFSCWRRDSLDGAAEDDAQ
jgi:hypothetical protein